MEAAMNQSTPGPRPVASGSAVTRIVGPHRRRGQLTVALAATCLTVSLVIASVLTSPAMAKKPSRPPAPSPTPTATIEPSPSPTEPSSTHTATAEPSPTGEATPQPSPTAQEPTPSAVDCGQAGATRGPYLYQGEWYTSVSISEVLSSA